MHYVYILALADDTPFYVGKGTNNRVFHHEQEARSGHDCAKCAVIRSAWERGEQIRRYTLLTTESADEAFDGERALIALIGRDILVNKTDGGKGTRGLDSKIRTRLNTLFRSAPWREQLRERAVQLWSEPKYRQKVTAAIQVAHSDPGFCALMSTLKREHWDDPAVRAKYLADRQSPARREQSRSTLRRLNQDPVFREKGYESRRTPEARQRLGTIMAAVQKNKWTDPEYRAKMIAIRREQGARRKEANAARRT